VREELAQLLVRYRCQLNEAFVQRSLVRTRYRSTNEIAVLVERPGNFSETELGEFNLLNKYISLDPCPQLARCSEGHEPPLRWYTYTTVHGMRGYVPVESKWGPHFHSTDRHKRAREDNYENLRSVYGLVRQFRAANNDYNDKYGVLSCLGFYYRQDFANDNSILLVWEPRPPVSETHNILNMITLREILGQSPPISRHLGHGWSKRFMSYFRQGGITERSVPITSYSLTTIGRRHIWWAFGRHGSQTGTPILARVREWTSTIDISNIPIVTTEIDQLTADSE